MEKQQYDVLQQLYLLYQTRCDRKDCSRTVSNFNSSFIQEIASNLDLDEEQVKESITLLQEAGYTKLWVVGGFELTRRGIREAQRLFQ
ncbi:MULTISPECIES: signal peptidase [Erysipelothrix]|uniref:Signal peptidase n=1 Tax=Erysipelothrix piscisicarius TaxID=2485784 RepID=A0A3Q8S2Y0_9FIRM|nr:MULTISPECIES: signal peptidase [Erysipelothrix]AZK44386.1 signal peptidase [Erysipelothrix piscisicarius]MBK2402412.1 signal peptidase [Erysipelothrix sp. strain 2 (EsS2-6-Brazil)]MBK2403300.1 signal peptidase [Erysipelothrix sp. strain 2 (EsS2-7-Brazil)]NBA00732.1 signal peptidase [Erysipelothrix rhusiopathiae]